MKKSDIYKILVITLIYISIVVCITTAVTIYILNTRDSTIENNNTKLIGASTIVHASTLNNNKMSNITLAYETEEIHTDVIYKTPEKVEPVEVPRTYPYSEYEIYELAKIIMCEAEGESQKCKEYIGQVVINRTKSDDFPDTIHDVIFEKNQFTPAFDGRWEIIEPDENSYNAAYTVINATEPITDALWFEACNYESWHSRNLTQIAEIDNTRFYIE